MNINDRQCLPLTVCSCQQYQSRAPGAASDRQCSAMTLCDDDQYESRYPKKEWLNVLETKFVYTSDREVGPTHFPSRVLSSSFVLCLPTYSARRHLHEAAGLNTCSRILLLHPAPAAVYG